MDPVVATILVIGGLAAVIVQAGSRGKKAVTGFYRAKVKAWNGSRPGPAPIGVKVGAVLATGIVGGGLWTRGFARGLREGWPKGVKASRARYEAYLADKADQTAKAAKQREAIPDPRCPTCRYNLSANGWPRHHNNRHGQLCDYDWTTDPKWKRCPDCREVLIPGETDCITCLRNQPADDAGAPGCARGDCNNPADLANRSIYCTNHPETGNTAQPQPLRLVTDNTAPTQGATQGGSHMAIDTVTGGEVRGVEQAQAELEAIEREATAEKEDADAEAKRAEEDAARYELFAASLRDLEFPEDFVASVAAMQETAMGRMQAAHDRANQADRLLSQVAQAKQHLDPHMTIREVRQAAGGVARDEAYAG